MVRNSLMFSIMDQYTPWVMKMINFKDYVEMTSDLDNSEIQGNLKVTTFLKPRESWWNYDFYPEIPYIIAHYLKLNLTFVEPFWNETVVTTNDWIKLLVKLVREEQIDYIIDPIIISEEIFRPEDLTYSTGLLGLHQISILTRKDRQIKSMFDEIKIKYNKYSSCS